MPKLRRESRHAKESNTTTTTDDKEKLLQTFAKARKDIESLVGHVPELDPLWESREKIEIETVLEDWKRTAEILVELQNELKGQCTPSQIHDITERLRKLGLEFTKSSSVESNAPPPEKSSETMPKVEMECDPSIEASGSVGTKKSKMLLKRSSRLSICAPIKLKKAEDNTEGVKLKSVSKGLKKKKKSSHKKSSKKTQTADTVSQDPNKQSSGPKDHDDTATTFTKTEIATETDLGPNETPECSKKVVIKQEVPVNFRLPDETEIIDMDAKSDQMLYLNELTEEEQQKVRDEIEPQLSSEHMIRPLTLKKIEGKYRIVSRSKLANSLPYKTRRVGNPVQKF